MTSTMFTVNIDRSEQVPLHDQVAAEIRRAIAEGEAGPGERLPLAKDISAVLGVNKNTVLRAMHILRDEGLVEFGRGSGITVHRADCINLLRVEKERQMQLTWGKADSGKYPAYLVVECLDRVGIAGDILKKISDNNINLSDLRVETHPQKKTATIHVSIEVVDLVQLHHIARSIGQISDVLRVQRLNTRKRAPGKTTRNNVAELPSSAATTSKRKSSAKSNE